ncbi:universal stress protein [Virgisporangium aurantiacum]|uniref:Universal stress protein n=1 Tax=Virgisporangium aurantiacum TaxID=175570 RepID=A0A8J3Z1S3_9ACTN|nr:universal stress protein [Virgisporangium aurantiacum]GIJ54708.1 universal stress protein [Virgisporangium aurantiacum]
MKAPQVIVGIGDAPGSGPTLRWAVTEAARRGQALRIVHAARPDACHSAEHPEVLALDHAVRVVTAAVEEARRSAPGVRVIPEPVLGCPAATLVAAAGRHDLLVVGDRERTGPATAVRGSTCRQVALRARSSVAVVRGRAGPETGPVAVGYDGSPAAESVLVSAFESAAARRCALTVIRASRFPPPGPADGPHSAKVLTAVTVRGALAADARRAVAPLADKYPDVAVDILITGDDPAGALVAASREARLVVIGAPGAGGVVGGQRDSVGLQLLRHSGCPVLIARP